MRDRARVLLLMFVLLVPTLFLRGIWYPDETRYAEVARGMLSSGQLAVPHILGEVYTEKPPVFFWVEAALAALGVPLEIAPRLISVVAGMLAVTLLPAVGAGLRMTPEVASRGALVLATTPLFLIYAQVGLLDAWVTFLVTAAIAAKVGRGQSSARRRAVLTLLEGIALGAALLTKGPVVLLFPLGLRLGALVDGPDCSARADRSDALALTLAVLCAGTWLARAHEVAGMDYVRALVFGAGLRPLGQSAPHAHPRGFLLGVFLVGFLPWSVFGAFALGRLRRIATDGPVQGLAPLAGWLVIPLALLSVSRSQQPHYPLPTLPAAALLVAATMRVSDTIWLRRALGSLGAVLGASLILAGLAPQWIPGASMLHPAVHAFLINDAVLRAVLVGTGAFLLALALPADRWPRPAWSRSVAGVAALFACCAVILWRTDPLITPRALLLHPEVRNAERLLATPRFRSSVCIIAQRCDVGTLNPPRELTEMLRHDRGLVALVWEDNLGKRVVAEPAEIEVIARGWVRGRAMVAVRRRAPEGAS